MKRVVPKSHCFDHVLANFQCKTAPRSDISEVNVDPSLGQLFAHNPKDGRDFLGCQPTIQPGSLILANVWGIEAKLPNFMKHSFKWASVTRSFDFGEHFGDLSKVYPNPQTFGLGNPPTLVLKLILANASGIWAKWLQIPKHWASAAPHPCPEVDFGECFLNLSKFAPNLQTLSLGSSPTLVLKLISANSSVI